MGIVLAAPVCAAAAGEMPMARPAETTLVVAMNSRRVSSRLVSSGGGLGASGSVRRVTGASRLVYADVT